MKRRGPAWRHREESRAHEPVRAAVQAQRRWYFAHGRSPELRVLCVAEWRCLHVFWGNVLDEQNHLHHVAVLPAAACGARINPRIMFRTPGVESSPLRESAASWGGIHHHHHHHHRHRQHHHHWQVLATSHTNIHITHAC